MQKVIMTLSLVIFASVCAFGQCCGGCKAPCDKKAPVAPKTQDVVKATLLKIFALVQKDKNAELAGYMVYRGKDKTRKWKSVYNYTVKEEKQVVDAIATRLKALLGAYSSYDFVKFIQKKESEGVWNVWVLNFKKDKKNKEVAFAFLKIGKQYAIGDID